MGLCVELALPFDNACSAAIDEQPAWTMIVGVAGIESEKNRVEASYSPVLGSGTHLDSYMSGHDPRSLMLLGPNWHPYHLTPQLQDSV